VLVLDAPGIRVVADPDALDRAVWNDGSEDVTDYWDSVWRFAPDEAFGLVGIDYDGSVHIDDPHAIVEPESGFLLISCEPGEFESIVIPHIEWSTAGTGIRQGLIAGIPAKIQDGGGSHAWILVARAHAHELIARLGIAP
jgi:hypothetical protein